MDSIHVQEDRLFTEYERMAGDGAEVLYDGLLYRGELTHEGKYWNRSPEDEEAQWRAICKEKRGLVVLTKDLNDPSVAWDIRVDHGRKNGSIEPSKAPLYRNLSR